MAATRLDRVGDGTTTIYDVTFTLGYLRREYVYVYLDGDVYTSQLSYNWINDTQVELNTPLAAGVKFSIRRVVLRDAPINDYESGAILREDNLDDSFLQHLMLLEEVGDGYLVPGGDFKLAGTLDMQGNRVLNVGAAVEDTDAISLGQADERFVNITGDTLTGALGGVRATASIHFPTLGQMAEIIDDRISAVGGDSPDFIDYGLVTESVSDTNDYGGL